MASPRTGGPQMPDSRPWPPASRPRARPSSGSLLRTRKLATRGTRKHRVIAAARYADVLNANLLAETHSWRYNATWRLASLLTQDDEPKSCAQALILWESAVRSGRRVWPSDLWPEHRRLLKGAQRAAKGAGEEVKAAEFAEKLLQIGNLMD
mmetsp:Transcript_63323/g.205561  ORF Transcript_63323/g.205561 Transcript_63323/m.205561 type:complete len:152 (+) Transcript_63323:851-1306(+)